MIFIKFTSPHTQAGAWATHGHAAPAHPTLLYSPAAAAAVTNTKYYFGEENSDCALTWLSLDPSCS